MSEISLIQRTMRSGLVQRISLLCAAISLHILIVSSQAPTTITPDHEVLYLVDFLGNGRPRYLDEAGASGNKIDGKTKDNVGIILINNPLKKSQARADGIYFKPADGRPLDPLLETVSKAFILA